MAQAVPTDTRSTFLAQLLAPITTPAADRRILRDIKRDLEDAWSIVLHCYYAADALRSHHVHLRRAAEIERRVDLANSRDEDQAQLALITVVDRMMHVPAPTIGALRQKEKLRRFNGGRERWEVAIAADRARLQERS